jgi:hypothetical protein
MERLNELWGTDVLDIDVTVDDADISIHHLVSNPSHKMICMKHQSHEWRDLINDPFDGIFRGRLI